MPDSDVLCTWLYLVPHFEKTWGGGMCDELAEAELLIYLGNTKILWDKLLPTHADELTPTAG